MRQKVLFEKKMPATVYHGLKNHSYNHQAWWSYLHIFQGTTAGIELSLATANL